MKFAPQPENDFAEFIRTYYRECRSRCDNIEAIAGKWMFRDLIPGMSDFDTRFIVSDDTTMDDWRHMSMAVGEAHLALCQMHPCWARNLEHLPGVNLTWQELSSEQSYYPEYQQWTYYDTERPDKLATALSRFTQRPWDVKDEYFHLKKFCLYYGRYDRTIDPAINLGTHANKYPLHSRIMHYFCPPVLSSVCLLEQRNIAGKHDGFEMAARVFPDLSCWDLIWEILHARYETPRWYDEPFLTELEDEMEHALSVIAEKLLGTTTLIPKDAGVDIPAWRAALQRVPIDPAMVIFDNAKFSRLMKGRLYFYCHAPDHFDTKWLIQNELGRLGQNFFRVPFSTYWRIKTGEDIEDPVTILEELEGNLLSAAEVEAAREFARLTPGHWKEGREREIAMALVQIFDPFFVALTKISQAV